MFFFTRLRLIQNDTDYICLTHTCQLNTVLMYFCVCFISREVAPYIFIQCFKKRIFQQIAVLSTGNVLLLESVVSMVFFSSSRSRLANCALGFEKNKKKKTNLTRGNCKLRNVCKGIVGKAAFRSCIMSNTTQIVQDLSI